MSEYKTGDPGSEGNPIFVVQQPASMGTVFRNGLLTGLGAGLATVGVSVCLALYNARVSDGTTTAPTVGGS